MPLFCIIYCILFHKFAIALLFGAWNGLKGVFTVSMSTFYSSNLKPTYEYDQGMLNKINYLSLYYTINQIVYFTSGKFITRKLMLIRTRFLIFVIEPKLCLCVLWINLHRLMGISQQSTCLVYMNEFSAAHQKHDLQLNLT